MDDYKLALNLLQRKPCHERNMNVFFLLGLVTVASATKFHQVCVFIAQLLIRTTPPSHPYLYDEHCDHQHILLFLHSPSNLTSIQSINTNTTLKHTHTHARARIHTHLRRWMVHTRWQTPKVPRQSTEATAILVHSSCFPCFFLVYEKSPLHSHTLPTYISRSLAPFLVHPSCVQNSNPTCTLRSMLPWIGMCERK